MNQRYFYWLVRYVPDAVRGERVNVGVVVGRDGADWAMRRVTNLHRASRLGGNASAIRPWLDRVERVIADYREPPLFADADVERLGSRVGVPWMEGLSSRLNNTVQVGEAVPFLARSAESGARLLYRTLVQEPPPVSRSHTRMSIVSDMNELFVRVANLEDGNNLLRRPVTQVGKQRGRFDFAVLGSRREQLSQAFAFDVRDMRVLEQELQSWNFIVSCIRNDGGKIARGGEGDGVSLDPSVAITAVYDRAPGVTATAERRDVFEAAREAWGALEVTMVPRAELDAVAREAVELVIA